MNEYKNLSKPRRDIYWFLWLLISFSGEPSIFFLGYEVITMIIVLVTTKEKLLGPNFNQENGMLVILLLCDPAKTNQHFRFCYR